MKFIAYVSISTLGFLLNYWLVEADSRKLRFFGGMFPFWAGMIGHAILTWEG